MRDQTAGLDPDRHERAIARPRRIDAKVDDDDEPTYVDLETSNIVSKHDFDALVAATGNEEDKSSVAVEEQTHDADAVNKHVARQCDSGKKQEVTQAGKVQKKRKAVKAVGLDNDNDHGAKMEGIRPRSEKAAVKRKKNDKAVKLSFVGGGDDEGG